MIVQESYSVRHLANGAARVYIKNSALLRQNGYVAGAAFSVTWKNRSLKLVLNEEGSKTVNNTARGELVEVRSKATGDALKGFSRVVVTFSKGVILIEVPLVELMRVTREASIKKALFTGKPLRKASVCSGVGTLAYQMKQGLESEGVKTQMAFAVDSDKLAISLQVEGNPIWLTPTKDAKALAVDIRDIDLSKIKHVHYLEIGYPCNGQSTLSPSERRDLNHPEVGTLFISICALIKALNPAILVLENAVPFLTSDTLSLMQRELSELGYRFESTVLNGYAHGDFEERERACVVGVSEGLPELNLNQFTPPATVERRVFDDVREEIADDSDCWSKMTHVTKKLSDPRLNFKHNLVYGTDDKIAAISAGYASPRIGSPMVPHPNYEENGLQRLFTNNEHSAIRGIPSKLWHVLKKVGNGEHPLVSKRGNTSHVHRLLGNGVSPKAWFDLSAFIGRYLNGFYPKQLELAV